MAPKKQERCPKTGESDLGEVTHMALAPVGYFETIGGILCVA
jgi:hypothetical protein